MKLPHNIQAYWDKGEESEDFQAFCGTLADTLLQVLGSDSRAPTQQQPTVKYASCVHLLQDAD